MSRLIIIFSLILVFSGVYGQGTMLSSKDNDPKAKKILDKLKKEYDTYKSLEVGFNLLMEFPGQAAENQIGTVIQQGDKYKLEMKERSIYSDGKVIWLHIKKNNEVQINDADMGSESDLLSPKDMLKLYESKDLVYSISDEYTKDGKSITKIEFKPLDDKSEYAKISLLVDKTNNKMIEMKIFAKDGSRYTLNVNSITPNKKYSPETFVFDVNAFPDIYIEDLRID